MPIEARVHPALRLQVREQLPQRDRGCLLLVAMLGREGSESGRIETIARECDAGGYIQRTLR